MMKIRHILCPVDMSDISLRALTHAAALARWYEAALTAFFVDTTLPIENAADFEDFAFAPTKAIAPGSPRALRDLRDFVARASSSTAITPEIEESTHVEGAILEKARVLPADLIVMGSHGRTGLGRVLIGSVAERVVRSAPCPVMVVPPHDVVAPSTVSFKHIVCPVDFSESSLAALEWALSLAEEADAQLSLLHVIEVPPELRVSSVVTDREIDELHASVAADSLTHMRTLVPDEAAKYCSVETVTSEGDAAHAILKSAADRAADLIVMGAQGHGAIDRWIFGSKTREVIAGAVCPVLTVRR